MIFSEQTYMVILLAHKNISFIVYINYYKNQEIFLVFYIITKNNSSYLSIFVILKNKNQNWNIFLY